MDSIKSQLMDMGFHEAKVKRAIESCPEAKTLEQVMEWLIVHEEELNGEVDQSSSGVAAKVARVESKGESDKKAAGSETNVDTESNDSNKKKLSVEEAQRLINERQAKRVEEERRKAIEDEKRRRVDGQKMAETRADLQDQERMRLAQQIRREKLEKEAHRKAVLDQIARDREAMRQKTNPTPTTSKSEACNASAANNRPKNSAAECRIAFRFPDGSSMMHTFKPKDRLTTLRSFVQEKKPAGDVEFIAPPNRKLDIKSMDQTLEDLHLCPASRLEVRFKDPIYSDLD